MGQLNLREVADFLLLNGYMVRKEEEYILTGKFARNLKQPLKEVVGVTISNKSLYKEFINLAEVPRYLYFGNGQKYYANQYSKSGERAFFKVINNPDINNTIFLMSTKLYYKSSITGKFTISNYLTKGIWETKYDELFSKIQEGGNSIEDYIIEETNEGERFFEKRI